MTLEVEVAAILTTAKHLLQVKKGPLLSSSCDGWTSQFSGSGAGMSMHGCSVLRLKMEGAFSRSFFPSAEIKTRAAPRPN